MMKKRIKNFVAGIMLTLLIPAFLGGQLERASTLSKTLKESKELAAQKADETDIPWEKAIAILP